MPEVARYTNNSLQALYGNIEAHEMPIKLAVVGGVATFYKAGQIVQETEVAGTYEEVVAGEATPCLILKNDVEVNAAGLHFHGGVGSSSIGVAALGSQSTPVYKNGEFDTREIYGPAGAALTNNAAGLALIARLGGHMMQGTPDAGIVRIG